MGDKKEDLTALMLRMQANVQPPQQVDNESDDPFKTNGEVIVAPEESLPRAHKSRKEETNSNK